MERLELGRLLYEALKSERQELNHIGKWSPSDPEVLIDGCFNLDLIAKRFADALQTVGK